MLGNNFCVFSLEICNGEVIYFNICLRFDQGFSVGNEERSKAVLRFKVVVCSIRARDTFDLIEEGLTGWATLMRNNLSDFSLQISNGEIFNFDIGLVLDEDVSISDEGGSITGECLEVVVSAVGTGRAFNLVEERLSSRANLMWDCFSDFSVKVGNGEVVHFHIDFSLEEGISITD